jgi:hypothetical protein
MVNDQGQLYTIEGVAAAILMVVTAYLVLSSTTIFTPQESHIADMQLEQLGHDALVVMNTPQENGTFSNLSKAISHDRPDWFDDNYTRLVNSHVYQRDDSLKYTMNYYFVNPSTKATEKFVFLQNTPYFRENAVKVTQWVNIDLPNATDYLKNNQTKIVLAEVLIWRG